MSKKILVTTKMMQDVEFYNKVLSDFELTFKEPSQRFSESECLNFVGEHDAWVCGDDEITKKVMIASQPKLKLLIKWGAGYDSIDTDSAKEIGIDFRSTPNSLSNAVAECTRFDLLSTQGTPKSRPEYERGALAKTNWK